MRAADDFATIRARMEELQRERREPEQRVAQSTYDAAWRLLELIGEGRGPMLSLAAAELRACLMHDARRNSPR
jgi:hypothetical protein